MDKLSQKIQELLANINHDNEINDKVISPFLKQPRYFGNVHKSGLVGRLSLMSLLSEKRIVFSVPHFQRKYEWKDENFESFLETIFLGTSNLNKGSRFSLFEKKSLHFGTMIFNINKKDCFEIVDGQQRIVSTFLLLIAMRNYVMRQAKDIDGVDLTVIGKTIDEYFLKEKWFIDIENSNFYSTNSIMNELINFDPKNKKLYIRKYEVRGISDKISDIKELTLVSDPIIKNYSLALEAIEMSLKGMNYSQSLEAIVDLLESLCMVKPIVEIIGENDNYNVILRSINVASLELSNFDKIKHKLFSYIPPEKHENIYLVYWKEIEQLLENNSIIFDDFISKFSIFDETFGFQSNMISELPALQSYEMDFYEIIEKIVIKQIIKILNKAKIYYQLFLQPPSMKTIIVNNSGIEFDITDQICTFKIFDRGLFRTRMISKSNDSTLEFRISSSRSSALVIRMVTLLFDGAFSKITFDIIMKIIESFFVRSILVMPFGQIMRTITPTILKILNEYNESNTKYNDELLPKDIFNALFHGKTKHELPNSMDSMRIQWIKFSSDDQLIDSSIRNFVQDQTEIRFILIAPYQKIIGIEKYIKMFGLSDNDRDETVSIEHIFSSSQIINSKTVDRRNLSEDRIQNFGSDYFNVGNYLISKQNYSQKLTKHFLDKGNEHTLLSKEKDIVEIINYEFYRKYPAFSIDDIKIRSRDLLKKLLVEVAPNDFQTLVKLALKDNQTL